MSNGNVTHRVYETKKKKNQNQINKTIHQNKIKN